MAHQKFLLPKFSRIQYNSCLYPNVVNGEVVVIFCSLDPLADVTSGQIRIFVWTTSSITNLSITNTSIIYYLAML